MFKVFLEHPFQFKLCYDDTTEPCSSNSSTTAQTEKRMKQTDIETESTPPPAPGIEVYQFRVYLREISPEIWRRFLMRSDSTLADLHYTLQILLNWSDDYLHQFLIRGKTYGIYRAGCIWYDHSALAVKLSDIHFRLKEKFMYEYDFFDHWQHELRLEQKLPFDPNKVYPVCTGGALAPPQEDCGGAWAFMKQKDVHTPGHLWLRLMDILEDGEAPVADYLPEFRQWLYWLKVDQFDRQAVNRRLKLYAEGNNDWPWPNEMHTKPKRVEKGKAEQ